MRAAVDPVVAAIRKRHSSIPQEALPLELPAGTRDDETGKRGKRRPKPAGRVPCPSCAGDSKGLASLDRDGELLRFRTHYRSTARGAGAVLCPASGTIYTPEETCRA